MLRIVNNVSEEQLREYGFKTGREYKNYEDVICNRYEYDDLWLLPTDEDVEVVTTEEDSIPLWCFHIHSVPTDKDNEKTGVYIDCVPDCTYHISNSSMEELFRAIVRMAKDGILIDEAKNK